MSNLLGVADNSEQNAHTYVYEPDKSLRYNHNINNKKQLKYSRFLPFEL